MSDYESEHGSNADRSSRGKTPQSYHSSREASPDDDSLRCFNWAQKGPSYAQFLEKYGKQITAGFKDHFGPTVETVMEKVFTDPSLVGIIENVFTGNTEGLDQLKEWYRKEEFAKIEEFFDQKGYLYFHLMDVVSERQDNAFLKKHIEELQKNETRVNDLEDALAVSQRNEQGLEEQLQKTKEALRTMHSDMLKWKEVMRQVEASVAGCKSALSPEQNRLINRVSSPRPSTLQAAETLVAVRKQLSGKKHRRDHDDVGGSSSGRGLASPRGGRGRGRGQGGHYGRS